MHISLGFQMLSNEVMFCCVRACVHTYMWIILNAKVWRKICSAISVCNAMHTYSHLVSSIVPRDCCCDRSRSRASMCNATRSHTELTFEFKEREDWPDAGHSIHVHRNRSHSCVCGHRQIACMQIIIINKFTIISFINKPNIHLRKMRMHWRQCKSKKMIHQQQCYLSELRFKVTEIQSLSACAFCRKWKYKLHISIDWLLLFVCSMPLSWAVWKLHKCHHSLRKI